MSRNKNLTQSERYIIETGINNSSSKSAIAKTIGKDPTTVAKEIELHKKSFYKSPLPMQCALYKHCKKLKNNACNATCEEYIPYVCKRRDRTPGACNGCKSMNSCRYNKYKYSADIAQKEYLKTLKESREGFDLDDDRLNYISNIVCPLLIKKQSPYMIVTNHPELKITEKTLYTYIAAGLFKHHGVDVMLLRRYVGRKISKKKSKEYKKREDRSFLKGRTYIDYEAFIKENPNAKVVQMDTVYNDVTNGPFMQTFKFLQYGLLIAIYREAKTADSMIEGFNILENALSKEIFEKNVDLVLTDRGGEFVKAELFEKREDGTSRTKIFYADPMASSQKASLENNHEELRYFFPKEKDLFKLGLTNQENLNIVLSHINSISKEKLNGKSPIELVKFFAPDLYQKLALFGIKEIEHDDVVLDIKVLNK